MYNAYNTTLPSAISYLFYLSIFLIFIFISIINVIDRLPPTHPPLKTSPTPIYLVTNEKYTNCKILFFYFDGFLRLAISTLLPDPKLAKRRTWIFHKFVEVFFLFIALHFSRIRYCIDLSLTIKFSPGSLFLEKPEAI